MLTVNADGHPVFQRMHKPGDEKRMVAILDPAEYDRWLMCTPAEAKGMCQQWMGPLDAFAAPVDRSAGASKRQPPAPPLPEPDWSQPGLL
jgi:putative SOS response-associated peptidase YedK